MKLYVCWGTGRKPNHHACSAAFHALKEAGYTPEVVKSYGSRFLPAFLNRSEGRRLAHESTGKFDVPLLVTDDDEVIAGSQSIKAWAAQNARV